MTITTDLDTMFTNTQKLATLIKEDLRMFQLAWYDFLESKDQQ